MMAVGFSGCTVDDCDCDSQIDDLLDNHGAPDEVDFESRDGVETETYFYCKSEVGNESSENTFVATFEWGDNVSGCCNFSKNSSGCTEDGDNGDENVAPVANDIEVNATSGEDTTITLDASDADGDDLTFSIVSHPPNGSVTTPSGNQVTYTSDDGFVDEDSFTYRANDGTTNSGDSHCNR